MKKKIVSIVAIVAGYNIYTSQNSNVNFSDLALANIEALAADPEITFPYICAGDFYGCYDPYYHEIFLGIKII